MKTIDNCNYTLITGASAGLGKQLAYELAKKNHNLVLVSLPDTGLPELAEEIAKHNHVDVRIVEIDLTTYEAPGKVFDFIQKNQISLNILVNNVGVGYDGEFEKLSQKLIDDMILLNVRTSTLLTFLFLPLLKRRKRAYILNIVSLSAFIPLPYKCVYAATKTYLLYLTRAMKNEIRKSGVSITSVYPTGVRSERALDNIRKSHPIARISSLSTQQVAQISIHNMFKGNSFVIPGVVTKFYYLVGSLMPHGLMIRIAGFFFNKNA